MSPSVEQSSETAPASSRALFAARALLAEFERAGLRQACLAPGSRSTPLALALAEAKAIRTRVVTDERSMAYFALGIAKHLHAPALVACTSGTAAANLLPAVVEASLAEVPLLVLTADRPAELRDCAAPQTIDQVRLYGSHARWAVDVPILDVGEPARRYYRALASRAMATACGEHAGPVHLNLPFREPFWDDSFAADACAGAPALDAGGAATDSSGQGGSVVETCGAVLRAAARLDPRDVRALAQRLRRVERGLLVCAGRPLPADEIAALAAVLQWPVLADPLSGLRYGGHDRSLVVDAYDVLLRDEDFRRRLRPDLVVRFGSTPAPRSLQTFLEESVPCEQLLIASAGWPDPFHSATTVVRSEPAPLCNDLVAALGPAAARSQWTATWLRSAGAARDALEAGLDGEAASARPVFEGAVARSVARATAAAAPQGATLFVGNSMPIRDTDTFFGQSGARLRVMANRGASGIDGVLSTALGVAAAGTTPTVLLIGDLSFLHDLTALALARRQAIPLVTVLVNNDGGGIFSYLPQQGLAPVFETLFATPHGVDVAGAAAALLGGDCDLAGSTRHLEELVGAAIRGGRPRVIEVRCLRETGPDRHRSLVADALRAARRAGTAPGGGEVG